MLAHRWGCCRASPPHLWIADQVRNDVRSWQAGALRGVVLRPVDSRFRGNDGME